MLLKSPPYHRVTDHIVVQRRKRNNSTCAWSIRLNSKRMGNQESDVVFIINSLVIFRDRKTRPKMSLPVFIKILALGLLE